MADTDLIERLNVHAASWRRDDAFKARDPEAEAAIAEEAAIALSENARRIAELEAAPSPSPAPEVVADSLWVPAEPDHKKIGWTYNFDQTERLSRAAEKATGYDAVMEVVEFVMAEADRRYKSALVSLSQPAKGEREGGGVEPFDDKYLGDGDSVHVLHTTPANPAQVAERAILALKLRQIPTTNIGDAAVIGEAAEALTAAIGAGGQAVAWQYFEALPAAPQPKGGRNEQR